MATAEVAKAPVEPGQGALRRPSPLEGFRGLAVVYGGPLAAAGWCLASTGFAVRNLARRHGRVRWPLITGLGFPLLYYGFIRRWLLFWGSTDDEATKPMAGDDVISSLSTSVTRAVTINAPRREVWRWLVQVGYERGGWYSYDRLEAAAGAGDFVEGGSATRIHDDLQQLEPGDVIKMTPWSGFCVASVEPESHLTLRAITPPGAQAAATWTFVLQPVGADATRLIARSRSRSGGSTVERLLEHFLEAPQSLMERKMLLGLKQRAEDAVKANACSARGTAIRTY